VNRQIGVRDFKYVGKKTLNLVETFIARAETCDALSRSVGQLDRSKNMADFSFREDSQNLRR